MVSERFDPTSTCQVQLAASKHLVTVDRPLLYADSGVENVNATVDATLLTACLDRILAQVEVAFSNSLIEAYWRSLKHQWLFLNSLDSVARVRAWVEFHVNEHNTKMPHPAFSSGDLDEGVFGDEAKRSRHAGLSARDVPKLFLPASEQRPSGRGPQKNLWHLPREASALCSPAARAGERTPG